MGLPAPDLIAAKISVRLKPRLSVGYFRPPYIGLRVWLRGLSTRPPSPSLSHQVERNPEGNEEDAPPR